MSNEELGQYLRLTLRTYLEKHKASPEKPGSKLPTSPEAKKLAALFSRKLTTEWSDGEIRSFRRLKKVIDLQDLELMGRYYEIERAKGKEGIHRRDLATFLNNYQGELDRARQWEASRTRKSANLNGSHPAGQEPPGFRDWLALTYPDRADAPVAECGSVMAEWRRAIK